MTTETHPQRLPWIVGMTLLLGTALGAGWFLNHTPAGGDTSVADKDGAAPTPPVTVCIGMVDADPGVVKLFPLVPGRVLEVVPEGSEVKKGDVLLKLDSRTAQFKLQEAKAALANAKELYALAQKLPEQYKRKLAQQELGVKMVKEEREAAYREFQIKQEAASDYKLNVNIKLAYEAKVKGCDARVQLEEEKLEELRQRESYEPQAKIKQAEADVLAKEAQVDLAQTGLTECSLLAPEDGTILRVLTHVGEVLGSSPMAPAIQFCAKGPKIIRAEVLQEWAYRVEAGQEVMIEDDTFAGATWQGRVKHVSGWFAEKRNKIYEPFMVNDVRTLECLIEVTSSGRPLRIGQRVRVKIKQGGAG
jgi:multidrug resistance efflux pump